MPGMFAPLYDPVTFFYYGSESNPTTDPDAIYETTPESQRIAELDYVADPYSYTQLAARPALLTYAQQLAQQYGDIPPLPTHLGLSPEDTKYIQDLAVFLNRSRRGVPIAGGRYGDNAGDGSSLGSLFANEFFLGALGAGAGLGASALGAAAAPAIAAPAATAPAASLGAGTGLGSGLAIGGTAAEFAALPVALGGAGTSGLSAGLLPASLGGVGAFSAGGLGAGTVGGTAGSVAGGGGGLTGLGGAAGGTGGTGVGTTGGILGTGLSFKDAAGLALTGAGLVQSGISQGNANAAQDRAADAAQLQADIARQLFGETQPLRLSSLGGLQNFLASGVLPFPLQSGLEQIRTTGREDLESQYNVARHNILGLTPNRGGQLNRALSDLELARARSVGRLGADLQAQYELPLRQQLYGRATELGFGQANNSLTSLGSSAGNLGNLAAAAQQQALGSGQAAGSLLALALKKSGRNTSGTSAGLFG